MRITNPNKKMKFEKGLYLLYTNYFTKFYTQSKKKKKKTEITVFGGV